MTPLLFMTALLFTSQAKAQDCTSWGVISPEDPPPLFLGQSYTFYVSGGSACGDASECLWWLDEFNSVGTLSAETGSPVEYTAPDTLQNCIPVSFQMFLSCPDASAIDAVEITAQCTEEDKAALLDSSEATVAGGGCTDPSSAVVLLPLLLVPIRRRR